MSGDRPSILGISFDGLPISGIVNEFVNVAATLRGDRFRVLLDFGGDIVFKDVRCQSAPAWVQPIRSVGSARPNEYTREIVEQARQTVFDGIHIAAAWSYDGICAALAKALVATFEREEVRILVVENGTLPDNPLFTEAIYRAIDTYGSRRQFGKYVLWRDHDLMWSSTPGYYPDYPYHGVRPPGNNEHIHYAVLTDWMRWRMKGWAPSAEYHVFPNRYYPAPASRSPRSLRSEYRIPEEACLIARCTRVIPEKSIDRDLRLLPVLQKRLAAAGDPRPLFLFVTGDTTEEPGETERLVQLARELSIEERIIWANGKLDSFNTERSTGEDDRFSIRDLLATSDLSSFLTSYDYEGFGNPPGEAMALGVPFITTTYELYCAAYGTRGAIAPLQTIDQCSPPDEPPPEEFVDLIVRVLTDDHYRAHVVNANRTVCRRYFSRDGLARQLHNLFGHI